MRDIYAFSFAVLAPGLAVFLFIAFQATVSMDRELFLFGFVVFLMTTVVAGMHVILLGIPFYYVLSKKFAMRLYSAIAAGYLLGTFPALIFLLMTAHDQLTISLWTDLLTMASVFGLFGAFSSFAFWATLRLIPQRSEMPAP